MFLRRNTYTTTTATNNHITRTVPLVGLHTANSRNVNFSIFRHITHLATRQGPANRLPRPIRLQIHATERQPLHDAPRNNRHSRNALVKHETVMHQTLRAGRMQRMPEITASSRALLLIWCRTEHISVVAVALDTTARP